MRVDERGRQDEPLPFHDPVAVDRQVLADLGDDPAVDADVQRRVELRRRVDHAGAANHEVGLLLVGNVEHHATASIASARRRRDRA